LQPLKTRFRLRDIPGEFVYVRDHTRWHIVCVPVDADLNDLEHSEQFVVRRDRIVSPTEEPT
jgi:hypothetical protein